MRLVPLAFLRLGLLATALALSGGASSAGAVELITNGTFDDGTAGWTVGPASSLAFEKYVDVNESSLSGSARFANLAHPAGVPTIVSLRQCLTTVQAGLGYVFGATVRFDPLETTLGSANLQAGYFGSTDCSGNALLGIDSDGPVDATDDRGAWWPLLVGAQAGGFVAPAGTKSVRVSIEVQMSQGYALTIDADDVFAAPAGTPFCGGLPATIVGSTKADLLFGTDDGDVIVGRGGADQIDGKGGNDRICGGAGADTIYGGAGDDFLSGGGDDDHLYGAADDDRVRGGRGNDVLLGGTGADRLKGSGGIDSCDGGGDADPATRDCETSSNVP